MGELITEAPPKVLAIYAHPDDYEMSCGGTVSTWAKSGSQVHVVIATRGEKGSSDPSTDLEDLSARREAETRQAAEVLGVQSVEMLGEPDGEVSNTPGFRGRLVQIVRRVQPDVVICPDPTAVFFGDTYVNHVDHRELGWAALDSVAPASASPLYFPEMGPAHQVSTLLLSGVLEPTVWVDISATLEEKVKALFCHQSQLDAEAQSWLESFVRRRAQDEAKRAGANMAEGFRRIRLHH